MVYKITWSELAVKTYISNIEYLEKEWTEKEIERFKKAVMRKLFSLSLQPRSGAPTNKRANLRKSIINKRIVLIYRLKPQNKEIELVRFFNTYQFPIF